nr:reverse transcriptase domain-containing protein [Tanacetum cinerariifolium]
MAPKKAVPKRTTRLNLGATPNPNPAPTTTTTTITNAQLQAMIDQGVNTALAARDANRTSDDSHTSRTGVRRTERWFERMETVFHISNCLAENQIKFATCTLLAGALTWWNYHEATEMATGLMDKKIRTYAERQAANKRKFEDTSRNNQGRK